MKFKLKFRFYPTPSQERHLAREFGCARYAYNWVLNLRTSSFKDGKPVNEQEASRQFNKHRQDPEFSWLRESSCITQQQAQRHLQTAFVGFFEKRTGYPKFKSKYGKQSATYTTLGFRWDPANLNLSISKLGRLNVNWSREFTGTFKTITITKDCSNRYFVALTLDEPAKPQLPKTGRMVGIDLGISRLATLSTGEFIANPRWTTKHEKKLAKEQRILSRRKKGSGRYQRQKLKVAKIHAHIQDSRKDHMDKFTTDLVRRFDVICIEDLNVRGMVQHPTLGKHINCAAFGMFRRMLDYKTAWYDKELRLVDRFFPSSKRCHVCGYIHQNMDLSVREWDCPRCGTHHDRDHNSSKNILHFAVGQTVSARGGQVRPKLASAGRGTVRGSVNQPALLCG